MLKETAEDFFSGLEQAVALAPDYSKAYCLMNRIFQRFLDQQTVSSQLNLTGAFAKTDYLLKEHEADKTLAQAVNSARIRLKNHNAENEDVLTPHFLYDLKSLCLFVGLVFRCEVPESLRKLFPAEEEKHEHRQELLAEYIRIIVNEWDSDYVYGECESMPDFERLKVSLRNAHESYGDDWSYIADLLFKGAQLNIIRPRMADGIVQPELIVFSPDILIDISTVARCFTNYAESPLVNLLHKIEPQTSTEAILLGNFAGQLLDEAIHQLPSSHTYADSAREFFSHNALSLLTTDLHAGFHNEAQEQKRHIEKAVNETLPRELSRFDSRQGLVEPSFFSEMLGIQGRMDYLQLDMRVLLEQKSGKGEFPYDGFRIPRHREEHYVQLLLYMMLIRYNYREIYEQQNNRELHAFLLYSKYSESLLGLGFAPQLMFRALKIRNQLAWMENFLTLPKGFRMLETLTPEKMNQKNVDNKLWHNYQRNTIARILEPIHSASELEREYCLRFLTFVANEHMLSRLGNRTKEASGFASLWQCSLDEKLSAGSVYCNLRLQFQSSKVPEFQSSRVIRRRLIARSGQEFKSSRVTHLTLCFPENAGNDTSNFRVGDIVILYPYSKGTVPDARKTMVFRSTIEDMQTDSITLRLRSPQTDNRVFLHEKDKLWAIEHDFLESSFSGLYRGVYGFLSAPKERRNLLLLQREPRIDKSLVLSGEYGQFNDLSLRIKQARELFLVIGPPGTGKTSYGLLNTVLEELLEPNSSVLLMAYTNRAVDEICSKLQESGIDFIRIGAGISFDENSKERLLSSRVFVGTTTALSAHLELFQLRQFSLAVIDEASQILEPHLLGLLSATHDGRCAIERIVMIGDHKQLPAVVQQQPEVSKVECELLHTIHLTDCRMSLFERLLRRYVDNPAVVGRLTKQGRMHPDIAAFPNAAFYNNTLEVVPLEHQKRILSPVSTSHDPIDQLLLTKRVAFLPSKSPQLSLSDKVNQPEADIIASLVVHIYNLERATFNVDETVGVIVPYRNQIATVRNTIDSYGIPVLHDITIDTVERYQGSQRDYIIYGFTISKPYQLNFLTNNVFRDTDGTLVDRKLNVAMTRAREHLYLIGNPDILSQNTIFNKLMEFLN